MKIVFATIALLLPLTSFAGPLGTGHIGSGSLPDSMDMEPICALAARMSAAAFRESNNYTYEQRDTDSLDVYLRDQMMVKRENIEQVGDIKFIETYLVQLELASRTEDVARVVVEAYNKDQGFCVIRSISAPGLQETAPEVTKPVAKPVNKSLARAQAEVAKIQGNSKTLTPSMCKQIEPITKRLFNEVLSTNGRVDESLRSYALKLGDFSQACALRDFRDMNKFLGGK